MFPRTKYKVIFRRRGGGFSPLDISGLQLWLDFSDETKLYTDSAKTTPVTSDGDVIGAIEDKSGNSNDAVQATTANKPLYKTGIQNGLSIGRFDGANDWMSLAGMTVPLGSYTVFAVYNPADIATTQYIFDVETGRLVLAHTLSATVNVGWYDGTAREIAAATTDIQLLTFHLTSGGNGEVFRNASSLGTAAYAAKAIGDAVGLFSRYDGADLMEGDCFELLLYNAALSTLDRETVRDWLNAKWAVY